MGLLVERSLPLPPLLPDVPLAVLPPRRSEKTSRKPLRTGEVSRSTSRSWSRTVRPPSPSCPLPPPFILKALKEPPRDRKKTKNVVHNGKLNMENIFAIAKEMRSRSMAASFRGTVLEVLGTCVSVGCTIDGKSPKDI